MAEFVNLINPGRRYYRNSLYYAILATLSVSLKVFQNRKVNNK